MAANTPKTRKAKGREFQKEIVRELRQRFELDLGNDDCYTGDIQAVIMGEKGCDVKLSPVAKCLIPFNCELKRTEKANVWQWIEQAKANSDKDRIPLVCFKRNRSESYAIIRFKDLLYVMN